MGDRMRGGGKVLMVVVMGRIYVCECVSVVWRNGWGGRGKTRDDDGSYIRVCMCVCNRVKGKIRTAEGVDSSPCLRK